MDDLEEYYFRGKDFNNIQKLYILFYDIAQQIQQYLSFANDDMSQFTKVFATYMIFVENINYTVRQLYSNSNSGDLSTMLLEILYTIEHFLISRYIQLFNVIKQGITSYNEDINSITQLIQKAMISKTSSSKSITQKKRIDLLRKNFIPNKRKKQQYLKKDTRRIP